MLSRTFSRAASQRNVALILSGCGVYDGSEATEAVSALIHLSESKASVTCYAPDKDQMHVINHTNGEEMEEKRNVLVESARIARGAVEPLASLDSSSYDALIVPGGFGAAKNLSSFATQGPEMEVDADLSRVLDEFKGASKPIGLCCIAPTIAAKQFGGIGVKLTVGLSTGDEAVWPHAGAAGACEAMGAIHTDVDIDGVVVDLENKIVSSPAYMKNAAPHEVHFSVGKMVKEVMGLI
ncbi:hypothetical protein TrCOL_g11357 [Triparma columacea]|uniref:Uncharacterized protein n=1 Tax=Triparma columacea TaxID=722753 RepID=A0A9W7GI41_9STRA|nr:hypothetical protein TrCOL_g11357 [Triparma columacea]